MCGVPSPLSLSKKKVDAERILQPLAGPRIVPEDDVRRIQIWHLPCRGVPAKLWRSSKLAGCVTLLSLSLFLVWKVFSVFTFIIFIANGIIIIWIVDCNNVSCSDF